MLITLFAWIYISIICLIWGHMTLSLLTRGAGEQVSPIHSSLTIPLHSSPSTQLHPSLICLSGLATIGALALGLSLFIPLGWTAHLVILIPAIAWCGKKSHRQALAIHCNAIITGFPPSACLLLATCIVMTLILSVHTIMHPDTLAYHARSILLFQQYKAIPGIANLKPELGFQSAWFAILAIFQPVSSPSWHIITVNGAVLCWFFCFVVHRIAGASRTWAWLLLLVYTLWSFTQVRLTATSASPDFIVTIYCWAACYSFMQAWKKDRRYQAMILVCCIAALLIKASAIMIGLLALVAIFLPGRLRQARPLFAYAAIALILLFSRNMIASGYLLYPSPIPDIFHAEWKMRSPDLHAFRQYITMYARIPADDYHPEEMNSLPFRTWIPRWWAQVSLPDRLLLISIMFAIGLNILVPLTRYGRGKKRIASFTREDAILLVITFAGSLVWFLGAPHPRFGTGFLLPLLYLLIHRLPIDRLSVRRLSIRQSPFQHNRLKFVSGLLRPHNPTLSMLANACLAIALIAYSGYRCYHFLAPNEWIYPSGIAHSAYTPLGCDSMQIDLLNDRIITGSPAGCHCCKTLYFGGFSLRDTTISEGFKPAEQ